MNYTKKNRLTDVQLEKLFGIPKQSLQNWKNKDKENWRYRLYVFLNNLTVEEIDIIKKRSFKIKK